MGLWLGLSVLTVFEIVELIVDLFKLLLITCIGSSIKRQNGSTTTQVTPMGKTGKADVF